MDGCCAVLERKGAASRKLILVPIFSSQKLQLGALAIRGEGSRTAGAGFGLCRAAMAQVVPC
jgi:hypothetical protein